MSSVSMQGINLHYDSESLVVEKNTFVTVAYASSCDQESMARTQSVPPSMRLARERAFAPDVKLPHDGLKPMPRAHSLAEVSTVAGSWASCASDTNSDAGSGSLSLEEEDAQSEICHSTSDTSASCSADPVAIALCDLVEAPVAKPRQRLSTKARAFVSSSTTNKNGNPCHFRSEIDSILAAVQAAVVTVGIVLQISIVPGLHDLSVVASIPSRSAEKKELVLSAAKEALLQAAERSGSTYCLGYAAKPFTPTPDGFSAKLADMRCEHSACWDMFSTGSCRRGCYCHWEHPAAVVTLNMSVVVTESA